VDAVSAAAAALVNALAAANQATGQVSAAARVPALLALAGQDVAMLLLGPAAGGGVNLSLPSGQVLTAQGRLPYPEGTQLLIRVLGDAGTDAPVRLQVLQATPPAVPAILAPLLQGEAAALQASLGQPDPAPGLADLAALSRLLGPAPEARIQAALEALPAPSMAALKTLLDLPGSASPATLASALETWLAGPSGARPQPSGPADPGQRFQAALERHPELPPAQGEALAKWFKQLLDPPAEPGSPAHALQQQLGGRVPAEVPETWEAWIRTSVKTLNDPSVAPQGAAFHAAQAKEGTAFYQIPLPWAPQQPLEMWVESEREPRGGRPRPETRRVLLGLSFSNLGETRLGIAKGDAGLQVRVWTEHPELLQASRSEVEGELGELGASVDLKIMALTPGPAGIPSLRSQVTGATLEAMG